MGRIIHLNGDPHEQAQRLLPWYANGTLDPSERGAVEAHLADCAECRNELRLDLAIGAEIAAVPVDADRAWAAFQSGLNQRRAPRISQFSLPARSILRRRVPLGWALSAQAVAMALIVGVVRMPVPLPQPVYHALSAPSVAAHGNLVVIFRPDATEEDLRRTLMRNGARLVDGPTVSDAYVLRVAADQRAAVLGRLRQNHAVVLAEPIDADGQP